MVNSKEHIRKQPGRRLIFWFCVMLAPVFFSCELEKEIEVKLPPFSSQLVSECYLERGEKCKVYVSETDSYFDTLRFFILNDATVRVFQGQKSDTLPNNPTLDFLEKKIYNYTSDFPLELDTNAEIQLEIKDKKGRTLTGTTRFLPKPNVDTIIVQYNLEKDSLAGFLIWLNDFPGQPDFYRIIMNEDSLNGPPVLDFVFTDNLLDGKRFPIGTSYRFKPGVNMHIRIFHIEKTWYEYIRSISAASRANGNPFAQPATVHSSMDGGFGIFTTLNYRLYKIPI